MKGDSILTGKQEKFCQGVADGDPRIRFKYGQMRGKAKEYAARVSVEPMP